MRGRLLARNEDSPLTNEPDLGTAWLRALEEVVVAEMASGEKRRAFRRRHHARDLTEVGLGRDQILVSLGHWGDALER